MGFHQLRAKCVGHPCGSVSIVREHPYPRFTGTVGMAVADFAVAYADQTERDYEVLMKAARAGRLEVISELD